MAKSTKGAGDLPAVIENEAQLDELLSRPSEPVIDLFSRLKGSLAIVGGGGKIGPSLVAMACRARAAAGTRQKIRVIDRFPDPRARQLVRRAGAEVVRCDLLDPAAVRRLPPADHVVYMVGMKFGTTDQPWLTWAVNALVSDYVGRRYRNARIVAFSTGCVYNLVPVKSKGSKETDPLEPMGEYSNSCVARERILEYAASLHSTPLLLFRLNYAVELRYGVLVDLATEIAAGRPVDLTMGYFNAIWQGDVNAAALRLLEQASYPPRALNVSSVEQHSVRKLATELGRAMGRKVTFVGKEAPTALFSDCSAAAKILGRPTVSIDQAVRWVGDWIGRGGRLLGKPTHFQTRDGRY